MTELTPHFEEGHANVYHRDQDTCLTGYGRHHRVIAFLPDVDGLYCRVDHKHGPRAPSHQEILLVARTDQGIKGRWTFDRSAQHADGRSTDFWFRRAD